MAENQLIPRHDRIQEDARETDWPSLIARAVDDITRIVHSEFQLLVVGMQAALDEGIDRVLAFVATAILMIGGAASLLAAVVMFLHEYLMLLWWQAFGITGLALLAMAIALGAFASRRPKPPAIT